MPGADRRIEKTFENTRNIENSTLQRDSSLSLPISGYLISKYSSEHVYI